jgi:methyl-accepting chemotaxis protein
MDLEGILTLILSGTTVGGIVSAIVYRRQNKKLKENEVKVSDANTQTEQINLGELFMQKSAEMFQKMKELQEQTLQATQKNGNDNADIIKKVEEVVTEQKRIVKRQQEMAEVQDGIMKELKRQADEMAHLVKFGNGEYQDFLERNGFKR